MVKNSHPTRLAGDAGNRRLSREDIARFSNAPVPRRGRAFILILSPHKRSRKKSEFEITIKIETNREILNRFEI